MDGVGRGEWPADRDRTRLVRRLDNAARRCGRRWLDRLNDLRERIGCLLSCRGLLRRELRTARREPPPFLCTLGALLLLDLAGIGLFGRLLRLGRFLDLRVRAAECC